MTHHRKSEGFASERLLVIPPKNLHEMTSHPLLSPFFVTDIGYFPHAQYHYRDRPHGASAHIAMLCVDGAGWVQTAAVPRTPVQAGCWLLIPADTAHAYGSDETDPWTIYWFHFRGNYADMLVRYLQGSFQAPLVSPMTPDAMNQCLALFDAAYEALERGFVLPQAMLAGQTMLHLLVRLGYSGLTGAGALRNEQMIGSAIELMQQHVGQSLTLTDLARHADLSKTQFSLLFKQLTGQTPISYFLQLKMQRACQHLDLTDWSIQQIATAVGIADPYYFSRLFHKLVGQSPTAYRAVKKG